VIRSKEVVHKSWWCPPYYMSSCASPGSCGSQQLAAWDVERVAAGGCRRVRTWMRLRRRTCSSSSSSPSPATLTGPPGRNDTHHTLHGEPISVRVAEGAQSPTLQRRRHLRAGLLSTEYTASPARMRRPHLHGAWCPVRRSLRVAGERVEHLLQSVGSRHRLVWCVSGGARVVVRSRLVLHTRPFVDHLT